MQRSVTCCRRDLTINSLFYNINTREVEDFTGKGLDDLLEHKLIRTPLPASETFRDGRLTNQLLTQHSQTLGWNSCNAGAAPVACHKYRDEG